MLINAVDPEEVRVAVVKDGLLDELYIERTSRQKYLGNIYKGKVMNVEPAIQAAFIDFGGDKNGFLHVADLSPEAIVSSSGDKNGAKKKSGRRSGRGRLIQKMLRRGDELLVQVSRDGIGHKGPTLTTFVSVPGRCLVLMPQLKRLGVSKKVEDPEVREETRKILEAVNPPKDLGFIVRTAGVGQSKRELKKDLQYLMRLWRAIQSRLKKASAPAALYKESELIIRAIRDVYAPDMGEIILDSEADYKTAKDFMQSITPRSRKSVVLHDGNEPLFNKYKIESQIESLYAKKVKLNCGGFVVIEQTEALVAIDVNSGSYTKSRNLDDTSLKVNLEAAPEIARQLKLRDLGGVIVIDFIDMRSEKHRRQVERALREALKDDRARMTILRMSRFCLVEITRQKLRPGMHRQAFETCPLCAGFGSVKTIESVAINVGRKIKPGLRDKAVHTIRVEVCPRVAYYMLNSKRNYLSELEGDYNKKIIILGQGGFPIEKSEVEFITKSGEKKRKPAPRK